MNGVIQRDYDVIVIGGGVTGAGVARDCSMRGLSVLLVERHDLATGATGRNHGLLHSGARYAVTDQESARECIEENMILRRIARPYVEQHDGLFITLPEDDLAYQSKFVEACRNAGIRADVLTPEEAKRLEPSMNPHIIGAVRVPDGSVDPFRLTLANALDAYRHGTKILTHTELISFVMENGRVLGVRVVNHKTGEEQEYRARVTVNAAGIWGTLVARKAGVNVSMFPAKGSLLIFGHRVNNMVINRCRKPANADILVPGDAITVLGTTSDRVPIESVDDLTVTQQEVETLLSEGIQLVPSLASTRILRAYAGVRPLVASDDDPSGRSISRGIVCLDHETRDGLAGFITITGGKLMTYRAMAEQATNLVCKKLHVEKPCMTAVVPLPGAEDKEVKMPENQIFSFMARLGRHGSLADNIASNDQFDNSLICECEEVTVGEVQHALNNRTVESIDQLRRRTRVGMGTCQGQLCTLRAACLVSQLLHHTPKDTVGNVASFINERWKGMCPVAWGATLSEAQLTTHIYQDLCGINAHDLKTNYDKIQNVLCQ